MVDQQLRPLQWHTSVISVIFGCSHSCAMSCSDCMMSWRWVAAIHGGMLRLGSYASSDPICENVLDRL